MDMSRFLNFHTINEKEEIEQVYVPAAQVLEAMYNRKQGRVNVLEIGVGCGYGAALLLKGRMINKYTGIDLSDEAIREASKILPLSMNVQLVKQDSSKKFKIDFNPDLVLFIETIEHMTPKQALKTLKNIYKVISKEGVVYLTTPEKHLDQTFPNDIHYIEYTLDELIKLVHKSGFKINSHTTLVRKNGTIINVLLLQR